MTVKKKNTLQQFSQKGLIGNVGWRQMEQTFDAALIRNNSILDTTLSYAYISNIKDIFSNNIYDSK